ncbi:MAG: dTDP-4-dehydrorhamnose reductase [Desulfobacterales bacterium]|nr:dTDP-4-dehydrorhamnose reductase [Desulfobacterales bacterium]
MNVLITGARGQLGQDCAAVLGGRHRVTAVDVDELDIVFAKAVDAAVQSLSPEIIVNCAAFTNVDACESQKDSAWRVNADGPANLAAAAAKTGARLIHISTDYVFDGQKPVPEAYTESDAPHPLSVYGKSKLEGEQRIMEKIDNHVILRTAWLYGLKGKNFIRTILGRVLNEPQNRLKIVNDQYGSPTWSRRLAMQIDRLLTTSACGIYHASSEGYCTWYELATALLKALDLSGRLSPCTTQEYPTPAPRPGNSILENNRLKTANLNVMNNWQADLQEFLGTHGQELTASLTRNTTGAFS